MLVISRLPVSARNTISHETRIAFPTKTDAPFRAAVLGSVFLGLKAAEYSAHFKEHLLPGWDFQYDGPQPEQAALFFSFYYAMTGLHALHMVIGAGLLIWIIIRAWKGHFGPEYYAPVEVMGLYWHFVDIVWIFLFPFLYLIPKVAH